MTPDLATLPTWAEELEFPLDLARALIRKTAALQMLGRVIGATRLFTKAEAVKVRDAVRARQEKQKAKKGRRESAGRKA